MGRKKKQTIEYHIEESHSVLYSKSQYNSSSDVEIADSVLSSWGSGFETEGDAVEFMEEEMKKYDNKEKSYWTNTPPSTFHVVKTYKIRKKWS